MSSLQTDVQQDLLNDLGALTPTLGPKVCRMGAALAALDVGVGAAVEAVVDNPAYAPSDICRVLSKHGIHVPIATVQRHRRRSNMNGCKCPVKVSA